MVPTREKEEQNRYFCDSNFDFTALEKEWRRHEERYQVMGRK